ncbi:hypothetical protein PAPHI01_0271 [Pancytospora philotis]|nr:hypothetical protein PAPHI01_0271 [Pancytospora philotis]
MVIAAIWGIAAVFASDPEETADECCVQESKSKSIKHEISPLPGLFSDPPKYDRDLLSKLSLFTYKSTRKRISRRFKTDAKSFTHNVIVKRIVQFIAGHILLNPNPLDCIRSYIAGVTGLTTHAMLAEILRNYTAMPEDNAAQLSSARDGVLVLLDEKIRSVCGLAPSEFLSRKGAGFEMYDILVYLFRGQDRKCEASKEAVREKFRKILESGYEDMNYEPSPTYDKIMEMVKYLRAFNARDIFNEYRLRNIIMSFITSQTDARALRMLEKIGADNSLPRRIVYKKITAAEILDHMINDSKHVNVEFALMYIPYLKMKRVESREMQADNTGWEIGQFRRYFVGKIQRIEALCADQRLLIHLPTETLYYLIHQSISAPMLVPGLYDHFVSNWQRLPEASIFELLDHAHAYALKNIYSNHRDVLELLLRGLGSDVEQGWKEHRARATKTGTPEPEPEDDAYISICSVDQTLLVLPD